MTATPDEQGHGARVDAWLLRATAAPAAESLERAFEAAFGALWTRAHRTLGDVTLAAITDRVLYVAAEQFPLFSALAVEATGLTWEPFRQQAAAIPEAELTRGVRFVLVELLTVLGSLTAEVLTPPLHAELDRAAAHAPAAGGTSDRPRASSSIANDETKP